MKSKYTMHRLEDIVIKIIIYDDDVDDRRGCREVLPTGLAIFERLVSLCSTLSYFQIPCLIIVLLSVMVEERLLLTTKTNFKDVRSVLRVSKSSCMKSIALSVGLAFRSVLKYTLMALRLLTSCMILTTRV